jgi:hypothetical protein
MPLRDCCASDRSVKLTTHHDLLTRFKMHENLPPLLKPRDNFTSPSNIETIFNTSLSSQNFSRYKLDFSVRTTC